MRMKRIFLIMRIDRYIELYLYDELLTPLQTFEPPSFLVKLYYIGTYFWLV